MNSDVAVPRPPLAASCRRASLRLRALMSRAVASSARARDLAAASAFAASWAERLQVDGLRWSAANPATLDGTHWLRAADLVPGEAHAPAPILAEGTPAADLLAADAADSASGAGPVPAFCAHLRLTRLAPAWPDLVRAEIRVAWERSGMPIDCTVDPAEVDAAPQRYGAVYLTAGVLRIPLEVSP